MLGRMPTLAVKRHGHSSLLRRLAASLGSQFLGKAADTAA
jgi:hypothetical protein